MATSRKDRDPAWEKDRAIVDRLVAQLRPESPAVATTQTVKGASGFRPPVMARAVPDTRPGRPPSLMTGPRAGGVWGRVALGLLLGVALTQWSYDHACGLGLLAYLSAVAVLNVTGLWGAVFAWRGRLALAHVVALATVLWGLALTTHAVLPHVGDASTVTGWRCAVLHQ